LKTIRLDYRLLKSASPSIHESVRCPRNLVSSLRRSSVTGSLRSPTPSCSRAHARRGAHQSPHALG
jgi:hypothetical protein